MGPSELETAARGAYCGSLAYLGLGGVSVMLDRVGRTDVNLTPGEDNEATVEVPRGLLGDLCLRFPGR